MKFCYDNIQCAQQILKIISESLLSTQKFQDKVIKMYLISDILYNSKNMNIFNSWVYKKEIELILPEIFENLNKIYSELIGRITAESFKEQILTLLRLWKRWDALEPNYIDCLEIIFVNLKEEVPEIFAQLLKTQLESYEDELLENYTENEESFRNMALSNAVYPHGEITEIISKLVSIKGYKLLREFEKVGININLLLQNEKLMQEKEFERKCKENLNELEKRISQLKIAINSFQTSYRNINEFDVDGYIIDPIEYEYLNINVMKEQENKNILQHMSNSTSNLANASTNYDEDIDGEPI